MSHIAMTGLFLQSVFGRHAIHEDVHDTGPLRRNLAMRWIVSDKCIERGAASTSHIGRYERERSATGENVEALVDVNGILIARVLAVSAIVLLNAGCVAGANERPNGPAPYTGPMIDAHSHPRKIEQAKLAAHFKDVSAAGVERVIVMRTPNDFRKEKREKQLRRATLFANVTVLCSSNFVGYIHQGQIERARREVAANKRDLAARRCAGVGEVGLRHYDKRWRHGGGQPEVIVPLDHALVHEVLGAANQHGAPVILHIEPVYQPRSIDNLKAIMRWYKAACRKYPRVRFVAAHMGMMSPANLEELLGACANLFADVKVLHSEGAVIGFEDLYPANDLGSRFFLRWVTMFEKHPNRFFYGSDWKEGRRGGYATQRYSDHITLVRRMIGSLSPAVQKKFAYSNAKRIFRLP